MSQTRSIYGLFDPREIPLTIRYIGCTSQALKHRLRAHLLEAETSKAETDKLVWLRSLIMEGIDPGCVLLERCSDEAWEEREIAWISQTPNLLNDAVGGRGQKQVSQATRSAISRALVGRKQSDETKAKRSASLLALGYKHSPEALEKIRVARNSRKSEALSDEHRKKLGEAISGLIWINDGSSSKRIPRTEAIPQGWRPGRKL